MKVIRRGHRVSVTQPEVSRRGVTIRPEEEIDGVSREDTIVDLYLLGIILRFWKTGSPNRTIEEECEVQMVSYSMRDKSLERG